MNNEEFQLWLQDTTRASFRILLVEIDHSGGTVYLATRPWLSKENIAYNDFITRAPYLEDDLNDFLGIGDFEAVNPDNPLDWNNYQWYGHECRWYYGDMTWTKNQFRTIATSNVEEVRPLGAKQFRFELMNNGTKFRQTLVTANETRTETLAEAVAWVDEQTGINISLDNVPGNKLAWDVEYELTPRTTAEDVLRLLATSINAHLATDQLGNARIFVIEDRNIIALTEDVIVTKELSVDRVIPAYANVSVVLANDTILTSTTNAQTGVVNDTIEITTALVNTVDGNSLLAEYVSIYSSSHRVWQVPVVNAPEIISVGVGISVVHPDLNNVGFATRIKRRPDSAASIVEVYI